MDILSQRLERFLPRYRTEKSILIRIVSVGLYYPIQSRFFISFEFDDCLLDCGPNDGCTRRVFVRGYLSYVIHLMLWKYQQITEMVVQCPFLRYIFFPYIIIYTSANFGRFLVHEIAHLGLSIPVNVRGVTGVKKCPLLTHFKLKQLSHPFAPTDIAITAML